MADELPQIAELDLSPVVTRPDGVRAIDARVRVQAVLRASEIRCSSSSVPTPRLCMASATAKAASADREPSPAHS